ncbi:pyridoxal 5'-phosphate synthase glutaminase subunit PdxT [Sanguibacter suaedae]|uniref:Pyridoxal 5'-phosphate synthase subunit PdxT n=1 Tax=Sanguibacter suaedae TaxID=2795737 RepID=A0A934IBD0_9MICO|nr:pyridoxal 5'-phosphate synthase glutaminase subunit PdxT [Sanguibacter suaedae]MBI9115312.1 pyridoxal 5'-phosphate synthase glutaminase subunit PdxT [Sanguibacter suaedae]
MSPTIGVLALQGDVREHRTALESAGARWTSVRRPAELDGLDGLVLPGGESTTIDKLLRIFELHEPLREAIASGLPVYGSCAGMILLADRVLDGTSDQQTLGGLDVTVRRNAFGRQVDSFETHVDVEGVGGPGVRAAFIRAPWVEEVGPRATVLATIGAGPAAGRIVAVRQGSLLATSFHPEITGDARIHELFVSIVRKEY